jgi:hypothetical protein
MKPKNKIKLYFLNLLGLVSLLCVLLPWMSYGVGSKTGLDIGRVTLALISIGCVLFLVSSQIYYHSQKLNRFLLVLCTFFSFVVFFTYLFEIVRVTYLTTVAKNLPIEMFGAASMVTAQIHIGYGLWVGLGTSFVMGLVQLLTYKSVNKQLNTVQHLDKEVV